MIKRFFKHIDTTARQFFCQHSKVKVIRYHASKVPPSWKPNLLYVDRHEVHNFVKCVRCDMILATEQREKLFEQKEDADE